MTDQDFLRLLNAAVKMAKPLHQDTIEVKEMDASFTSENIDSLDMLMIGVYLTDVFGVDEETAKTMNVKTPRELREFLLQHGTKEVVDVDAAIAEIK
jgi:acyl carrier protein